MDRSKSVRLATLRARPRIARETELVLDVDGPLGVVRQLFLRMFEQPQILGIDTEFDVPVETLVDPVLMPLFVVAGFDEEEFHLHLLELSRVRKMKLPGDPLRKLLPIWAIPNGGFAGGGHHVLKLTKMPCAVSGRR